MCCIAPSSRHEFRVRGGIMAYEHLRTEYAPHQQLTDFQIANITQSIMLHPVAFEQGQSSPVAMLTHLGAFLDVYGYGALGPDSMDSLIHRDTVREIERAFPRLDMNEMTVTFGTMLKGKPDSFFAHFLHERQLLGDGSVADTH
ncbi:hypothetical protein D9757_003051 [Collybiopsis confluens]|uniref:Uncharacterized protein n=1 Tax=Collybiopsis confluens TaxID=2823264 RepID=A0A8H5MEP8_9AGAR|nr:hypothetical protein D9757_003051 [Collybiopsis confluens]